MRGGGLCVSARPASVAGMFPQGSVPCGRGISGGVGRALVLREQAGVAASSGGDFQLPARQLTPSAPERDHAPSFGRQILP